jgi:hypothetical protein
MKMFFSFIILLALVCLHGEVSRSHEAGIRINGDSIAAGAQNQSPQTIPERERSKEGEPKVNRRVKVVLRVLLQASGEVGDISVFKVSPKDLSKEEQEYFVGKCKEAAKKITFKPAMKGGHPVSQWVKIEYKFEPEGR